MSLFLTSVLVQWLVYSGAVWVASQAVPGITLKGRFAPLMVGALLGLVNFLFAKLLFVVLSIATIGLLWLFGFFTRWLIAAFLFKAVDVASDSITVKGFLPALFGGGLVSVVVGVASWVLPWARW